ncbi:MAG: hypothetical protein HN509_01815 [Halobacteriovoraceae bacterium]|jgi:hypothetical protein|nr:hypothetical protein [Halobacteriovoraceae bacterium]MBT5095008.1 hypothetical protein [Halobacteriovoraceae bacterium]
MMAMQRVLPPILLAFLCLIPNAFAAYWDTLPAGVRAVVWRNVTTSSVQSEYSAKGQVSPYFFNLDLNAQTLSDMDPAFADAFSYMASISPAAVEAFSAAKYEARGSAKADVNGFGFGLGITNRLSAYTSVPLYKAKVNINFVRTSGDNFNQVQNSINASGSNNQLKPFYQQVLGQLDDASGPRIQKVLVDKLGYQPMGNWEAQGLGDVELGMMYQLTQWTGSGLLLSGGVVLPTGRVDNPDILQDFGFGDGQTDVFLEFGGGSRVLNDWISLDSWTRLTYQAAANKELRVAEDPDTLIGSEKGTFKEKLGNKFDFAVNATFHATDWFELYTGYLYNYIGESSYQSKHSLANQFLQANTEQEIHFLRGGFGISTVELFKRGKFFLPMNTSFGVQKAIGGMNSPRYTRYDLEFRFFF